MQTNYELDVLGNGREFPLQAIISVRYAHTIIKLSLKKNTNKPTTNSQMATTTANKKKINKNTETTTTIYKYPNGNIDWYMQGLDVIR